MKTKFLVFFSFSLLFVLFMGLAFSVEASPSLQTEQFETPTAGPDGRIIYTVKEGDSCLRISLLHNIDINQLLSLNPSLDSENCIVIIGSELMIGVGGPANAPTSTPGAFPTPTQNLSTPTPFTGTTEICVLLFEDINGNGLREENELGLAEGAISVTNSLGGYSQTRDSISEIDFDTGEPAYICFGEIPEGLDALPESEKIPEGEYTISAAIPDGYNPTINLSYTIEVYAGDRAFVAFGAQTQTIIVDGNAENAGDTEGGNQSGLLGILGAVLLLGGAGLGWYATRTNKSSSRMKF